MNKLSYSKIRVGRYSTSVLWLHLSREKYYCLYSSSFILLLLSAVKLLINASVPVPLTVLHTQAITKALLCLAEEKELWVKSFSSFRYFERTWFLSPQFTELCAGFAYKSFTWLLTIKHLYMSTSWIACVTVQT